MSTYTVHEPPIMKASREERAESLVFVLDGFSWGACLFGPIYFLVKREWMGLAAFVAAMLLLRGAVVLFGGGHTAMLVGSIVLAIVAGFEANEIRRISLSLFGWRELAAVSGRSLEECEHRFFSAWLSSEPSITPLAWRSSPFATESPSGTWSRQISHAKDAMTGGLARVRRKIRLKS